MSNSEFDSDKRREQLDSIGLQMREGVDRTIRRRRIRNRALGGACAFGLVGLLAAGALASLPGGGSDPVAPVSAAAVLERAAQATNFRPRELQPGEYFYSSELRSTKTAYFKRDDTKDDKDNVYTWNRRQQVETWVATDKSGLLRSNPANFLTPADQKAAKDSGFLDGYYGSRDRYDSHLHELTAPPGWFSDESAAATTYDVPAEDVTEDLLEGYDLTAGRLAKLTRNQKRFNRYVRGGVANVSRKLSKRGASRALIADNTDEATFSLAIELLSQPKQSRAVRLRKALLRLAATANDQLNVDADNHDLLGRPAVSVEEEITTIGDDGKEEVTTTTILFDPETFVVLETREHGPLAEPVDPDALMVADPTTISETTTFSYGIVRQLRQRPDGIVLPPAQEINPIQ